MGSDMLGAAKALFNNKPGIACILGTGSNSCLYDGEKIVENISPMGYILGDEGSGAVIGKTFLNCLYKGAHRDFITVFESETGLTLPDIINKVYRGPLPNRFLAINRKLKGKGFFRTMYYMPCIIGAAIIGVMLTNLFDYFGFINAVLMKFGLIKEPIGWFSETKTAMMALVIGSVWNSFGINVLYFMAAMSNIPESLYESADLDGASGWVRFWKITLPMMAPVLQVILLLSINGTVHTCDYILTTTNGGPGGSTYTVMAYQVGKFVPGFADAVVNIGYGCAMAIVTSMIMVIVATIYLKLSKKMQSVY